MYKKILLPINPDKLSLKAFMHAFSIADGCGAEVTILHASGKVFNDNEEVMLRVPLDKFHADEDQEIKEVRVAVSQLLNTEELAEISARVKHEINVIPAQKHDYQSILTFAKAEQADLIVLGIRRSSPAWDLIIGNFKEWVIHYAERPVLVIHED